MSEIFQTTTLWIALKKWTITNPQTRSPSEWIMQVPDSSRCMHFYHMQKYGTFNPTLFSRSLKTLQGSATRKWKHFLHSIQRETKSSRTVQDFLKCVRVCTRHITLTGGKKCVSIMHCRSLFWCSHHWLEGSHHHKARFSELHAKESMAKPSCNAQN